MLWIDRDFVTSADLDTVDPEFSSTVQACTGMTVDGSGGLIRRAVEEAGHFLERKLSTTSSFATTDGVLSANHLSAIFGPGWVGGQQVETQRASLDQVVVSGRTETEWSPVKSWVVNRVLQSVYRAAANAAMQDRFASKQKKFRDDETNLYWPTLKSHGIPVVDNPLPCPDAVRWPEASSFSLSTPSGSGTQDASVEVVLTYVDESLYVDQDSRGNAESHCSQTETTTLATGKVLSVSFLDLSWCTGTWPESISQRVRVSPLTATGINIWARLAGQTYFRLQNDSPIPVGSASHTLSGDVTTTGPILRLGQYANKFLTIMDVVRRG